MPKPIFNNEPEAKIHEIIRVNHAGEYGAQKIYEGQVDFTKNLKNKAIINSMLEQEIKHLKYFDQQIIQRNIRPTVLMPLWNVGGYMLGAFSALLGMKTAMLVTQSVEEVIEEHYQKQLNYLQQKSNEDELYNSILKFKHDEIEHKNLALIYESEQAIFAPIISNMVKNICKIAIYISKKL